MSLWARQQTGQQVTMGPLPAIVLLSYHACHLTFDLLSAQAELAESAIVSWSHATLKQERNGPYIDWGRQGAASADEEMCWHHAVPLRRPGAEIRPKLPVGKREDVSRVVYVSLSLSLNTSFLPDLNFSSQDEKRARSRCCSGSFKNQTCYGLNPAVISSVYCKNTSS